MLSKVLSKNYVFIKCRAKQLAPQKMYMQMLDITLSVASLILPFAFKDIFCFCVKLGAGFWEKERLMKETIGNINLGTTSRLPGN